MINQSVAFQELRPLCVELSRQAFLPPGSFNPQSVVLLNSLKMLDCKLATFPNESFSQNLGEYVFVPIANLLKQKGLGSSQTEYVLRLISQLLRLSWRAKGTFAKELAEQLLPLITFLISQDSENSTLNQKSAGLRTAGCQVLYQFFTSIREQPYKPDFFLPTNPKSLSSLGHCITVLLSILEGIPEDPQVQLQSLEALRILYQDIIGDGELVSYILPGNVSSFVKVLTTSGLTVNYKVIIKTLEVMGTMLQIVYDDMSLDARKARFTDVKELIAFKEENPDWNVNRRIEIHIKNHSQHRNLSWLLGTSAQVKRALDSFIPRLLKRQRSEINDSLAMFVSNLLDSCQNSLSNCESLFVSTLVSIRQDPKYQLGKHIGPLKGVVKQYLINLADIIRFEDRQKLLSFSFALEVFCRCDVNKDYILVKDICSTMLDVLESDLLQTYSRSSNSKILEQSSDVILAGDLEAEIAESQNTLAILPKFSKEIEKSLCGLIMVAGKLVDRENRLEVFIETFLSDQTCATTTRKTLALLLSTWTIKGLYHGQDADVRLADLLDLSQDEEFGYGPCYSVLEFCSNLTEEITTAHQGRSMSSQEQTAMSVVFFSIETACSVMHEEFATELIDHLYIVVENLANSSPMVRHFAQSCSLTISRELYQGSVRRSISANVDYLVDSISNRLNLGMTEHICTVFAVICKIAGYETMETFKDVIETIFKLVDYYHGYSELCIQFFQLFEVIVIEMRKLFMSADERFTLGDDHLVTNSYAPWGMTNVQQLISVLHKPASDDEELVAEESTNFQGYFNSKIQEADSDDEDDSEEQEIGAEPISAKDKWSSPIPLASYRILLQVFNYGDRLLTHPSKMLRMQVLHVMGLIIPMLSTQYDSLLPQVASAWDTVVRCTLDTDYIIVKLACKCLQEMVHYAGDFVAKRFCELWDCWCQRSNLLRQVRTPDQTDHQSSQLSTHRKFPPVTNDALLALAELLLEGITVTELMLPDTTLRDILYCCLQILPAELVTQRSLLLADIVWVLRRCE